MTVTGSPPRVTGLDLTLRRLRGTIPPALAALDRLQRLDLAGNALVGPIPSELGNLTQLKQLYLHDNALAGPIPAELGNLTQLKPGCTCKITRSLGRSRRNWAH